MRTQKYLEGHGIDIYYNCQIADRRATKCLSIDPKLVKRMYKQPLADYFPQF